MINWSLFPDVRYVAIAIRVKKKKKSVADDDQVGIEVWFDVEMLPKMAPHLDIKIISFPLLRRIMRTKSATSKYRHLIDGADVVRG